MGKNHSPRERSHASYNGHTESALHLTRPIGLFERFALTRFILGLVNPARLTRGHSKLWSISCLL